MSHKWTQNDMPDMTGKVVIITGANSGLGLESTKDIAAKGATVVMACRNLRKAEEAKAEVLRQVPQDSAQVLRTAAVVEHLAVLGGVPHATQVDSRYRVAGAQQAQRRGTHVGRFDGATEAVHDQHHGTIRARCEPGAVQPDCQGIPRSVLHRDQQPLLGRDPGQVVVTWADAIGHGLQVAGQPGRRWREARVDDVGHGS